jgi:hypothetical protein
MKNAPATWLFLIGGGVVWFNRTIDIVLIGRGVLSSVRATVQKARFKRAAERNVLPGSDAQP